MPSMEEPDSSPSASTNLEDLLRYYKSQYEQLEAELADFQASSRELETELERDVEASEKRERQLQEKVESLGYEVDEWKVSSKAEPNENHYCCCCTMDPLTSTDGDRYRPSTSNLNRKPIRHKMPFRRRLRRSVTLIERFSSNYEISKSPTMTLSGKLETPPLLWMILNRSTMLPSNVGS